MFASKVLFALIFAVLLTAIFAIARRKIAMQTDLFLIFLIVLLSSWAGGIWVKTIDLFAWKINWIEFFGVCVIYALLLAVFFQRRPPSS
ncbi:MAG: hypothetical protein H8D96_14435 [Desulfobacterales bacterium]|uniref:Uncharacterized protein n=1 Tax=Candidatus Desulfatibia vada TaxID=2841696 RepID=A0A8J6TR03_9BACT|nr:hypothetical protein [Candidatus Desulfatibia vada]MBL6970625.1 hypothetical protein [Desulfobacterales bacterium]